MGDDRHAAVDRWPAPTPDLGSWIAETYHHAPFTPAAAGTWLKTLVLKAAWRRAIREHGLRLAQAVEQECSTDSLYQLADDTSAC